MSENKPDSFNMPEADPIDTPEKGKPYTLSIPMRARLQRGVSELVKKLLENVEYEVRHNVGRELMKNAEDIATLELKRKETKRLATRNSKNASASSKGVALKRVKLYDENDVKNRLEGVADDREHAQERSVLREMLMKHDKIYLEPMPVEYSVILDEMDARYPHFHEVTDCLRKRLAFASVQSHPALLLGMNLLLDGPPGVGKSSYLIMLSKKFNTVFLNISCACVSNSFDLAGLSSRWGNGRHGKLHNILVEQACPNPIVLLDEIEKSNQDSKSDFSGALFGLLEKNNAKSFTDEFIDVPMDASMINWFATSNHVSALDPAIKDRFVVLQVRAPNKNELRKMIPHIYRDLRAENNVEEVLSANISKVVIDKLSSLDGISIRKVKRALDEAQSNAINRAAKPITRKVQVKISDLPKMTIEVPSRQAIGFIWPKNTERTS